MGLTGEGELWVEGMRWGVAGEGFQLEHGGEGCPRQPLGQAKQGGFF